MKDNLVTILLILLIILVVGGVGYFIFFIVNENNNSQTSTANTNNVNTVEQPSENNNNTQENENKSQNINGANAIKMSVGETEERTVNNGTAQMDLIHVDDFLLAIPDALKQEGYNVELTNNDTVLNITSNGGTYTCKIARFSDKVPYTLTEEQDNELYNLYDEIATSACNEQGVTEEDDNYYDIYYDEYYKINASYPEVLEFYENNGIDRLTKFEGFTDEELENAWSLVTDNRNTLNMGTRSGSDGYSSTIFENNDGSERAYMYEFGGDNYSFAGLFLLDETISGDVELSDYEVDFWTFSI